MRIWMKGFFALVAIALLIWLVVKIGGITLNILSANNGGTSARDPQFAEEAERMTPPPELTGAGEIAVEFKDNSANWDTSVQTPVDQTAEELEKEARTGN